MQTKAKIPEPEFLIRPFEERDALDVRQLFTEVNRELLDGLAHPSAERYIRQAIDEEIGQIGEYYSREKGNAFFVAELGNTLAGMFGLERKSQDAVELRRMYVRAQFRRRGLARTFLTYAVRLARDMNRKKLTLSTAEIQSAALALYRSAGFRLLRSEIANATTSSTVGGGIRRYHFEIDVGTARSTDISQGTLPEDALNTSSDL